MGGTGKSTSHQGSHHFFSNPKKNPTDLLFFGTTGTCQLLFTRVQLITHFGVCAIDGQEV